MAPNTQGATGVQGPFLGVHRTQTGKTEERRQLCKQAELYPYPALSLITRLLTHGGLGAMGKSKQKAQPSDFG